MAAWFHLCLFYVAGGCALIFACMVVFMKNAVHATLSLVCVFVATAVTWLLLQIEFLSFILIIVYVGAVMTLFLFVIMMFSAEQDTQSAKLPWSEKLVALLGGLMTFLILISILLIPGHIHQLTQLSSVAITNDWANLHTFGLVLYTHHVLAVEVAALLLFVAMVAALVLTQKPAKRRQAQDIQRQIQVKPKDRIRFSDL